MVTVEVGSAAHRWLPFAGMFKDDPDFHREKRGRGSIPKLIPVLPASTPNANPGRLKFRPFYEIPEGYPYFMYFDRTELPWKLW